MSLHCVVSPEQFCLFPQLVTLARVREEREKLMRSTRAANTLKAYAEGWRVFSDWCRDCGFEPLAASSTDVADFATWAGRLRQPPYALESVRLQICAIGFYHKSVGLPSPVSPEARAVITALARERAAAGESEETAGKEALTVEQLRRICRLLGRDPIEVRDRAILLVGFSTARRRAELARIRLTDVTFEERGMCIWISRSKTDQEGNGTSVAIPYGRARYTCPVLAVEDWIRVRGKAPGPLFVRFYGGRHMSNESLKPAGICNVLKRAVANIGVDARDYGAHSMRSGMITCAARKKVDLRDIMTRSGQKSVRTVMRYVKRAQAFQTDPLRGVL